MNPYMHTTTVNEKRGHELGECGGADGRDWREEWERKNVIKSQPQTKISQEII